MKGFGYRSSVISLIAIGLLNGCAASAVKVYSGDPLPPNLEAKIALYVADVTMTGDRVNYVRSSGSMIERERVLRIPQGLYRVSVPRKVMFRNSLLGGSLLGEALRKHGSATCTMTFTALPGKEYFLVAMEPPARDRNSCRVYSSIHDRESGKIVNSCDPDAEGGRHIRFDFGSDPEFESACGAFNETYRAFEPASETSSSAVSKPD